MNKRFSETLRALGFTMAGPEGRRGRFPIFSGDFNCQSGGSTAVTTAIDESGWIWQIGRIFDLSPFGFKDRTHPRALQP